MPSQPTAALHTRGLSRKCVVCGQPAVYETVNERYCDLCACEQASRHRGEAAAGLEILSTTVRTLRIAGLSDEQLIDAMRQAITADDESRQHYEEIVVAPWQYGFHAKDDVRFLKIDGAK